MKADFEPTRHDPLSLDEVKKKIGDKFGSLPKNISGRIESGETRAMCGDATRNLLKAIGNELPVVRMCSGHENANVHVYLVISGGSPDDDIIIDPTASQFISGYNGIFIGTRNELRQLVFKSKIVNTKSADNPQEAFERTWGNTSRKFF